MANKNQLKGFYVLPDMQRQGIGKKLWKEVMKRLNKQKPTFVNLADYNEGARSFYEKIGFEDTGRRWTDKSLQLKNGAIIPEMEMKLY